MPQIQKNPNDNLTLEVSLTAYGEDLGTLYPQAVVHDPDNNQVSGSPFSLTELANDVYILRNAHQLDKIGDYIVRYIIYTDAAHTTVSTVHGEITDIVTVAIQSTTGLGGGGGDVFVELDEVLQALKKIEKRLNKKIEDVSEALKNLTIDVPEPDHTKVINQVEQAKDAIMTSINNALNIDPATQRLFESIQKEISPITQEIITTRQRSKKTEERIIEAVKKNRSTFIKGKFDKKALVPVLEGNANMELAVKEQLQGIRQDITKTLDMVIDDIVKKASKEADKHNKKQTERIEAIANGLNESVRKKLKFAIDVLRTLGASKIGASKSSVDINIKKA